MLKSVPQNRKLFVVTDLDGSLLDDSYSWEQARPALSRLREAGSPLVLNSSKTVAEMEELATELALGSPLIAENGGLLALPTISKPADTNRSGHQNGNYQIQVTGLPRQQILSLAHELRTNGHYQFSGFADWTVEQIAGRTGLSSKQAAQAQARFATEPIVWEDSADRLVEFTSRMSAHDVRVLAGGRFLHLMGPTDKADGMDAVLRVAREAQPGIDWIVVAVGDSANDLAMLEAADIAVVIPHPEGPRIQPNAPAVVTAAHPATQGWNDAILKLIDKYH